ncbi:dihydrolipoyl dehydrogenase [Stenotrophomonas maltophilia]|jgi:dihydrolipoamide dehydrogenase|uniref:Dihydrolipoyl dehydrogenase n=2 Tax=Gammaproteobacteria TaxID=1236 RepID=A0AAP7L1A3_STEMA|nr:MULTISPECIES: dihydrolipoyl dehydrogenase [Stenotrophomonas]KOQ71599.1 dihydrolipoamide dehydrogenase [Stenotrophomonas maltophilia]MBA0221109.1 dihydrolipoyl dehydrogenase [Stenotrophomonas maltophilia]MBE5270206.1 dihydrolipoyl dehydrogenase [Stenotrophomonas sp. B2]MBH1666074.1 dihydrolipoyl dehydrogenase [Stenotrophomonas maltophilia]MBH1835185.1 dihydrolipoyl dehydrogenase [Stenotrophomonas maltophilia]
MAEQFDVVVIGAGPAGYHAAIRAAQLGLKTACIDAALGKDGKPALGGTCLRVGCIPSKALLDSSRQFWNMSHIFGDHGISFKDAKMDVEAMVGRKDKIVKQFTGGIAMLFKANKVATYYGFGELQPGNVVKVKQHDGSEVELKGTNVIIAAGSDSIELPFAKFDGETIVDNVGGLDFTEVPNRLAVIGAGVIGLELGSVWKRLGAEVTILEALPEFLAVADAEVAKTAAKEFKKQGLDIRLGAKVSKTEITGKGKKKEVVVTYTDSEGEKTLTVDKLLVAVGRRAATKGLLAEGTGVKVNERGQIEVDAHCHTGVDGVWAVGDCVRGPMLAHKGFEEGIAVAELIAGLPGHVNFDTIPWVIYTEPELAWVGKTEAQLKAEGIPYKAGSFPFAANGRAVAMIEPAGFVKILAHAETDRILGMHLVGANVSELVHEGVLTMEFSGSADDLARICHAHPSLSEVVHDAAMAVSKRAIHKAN